MYTEGNKTGSYCYQTCKEGHYSSCEHNLADTPMIQGPVCSGIGGKCTNGSAFSCTHCDECEYPGCTKQGTNRMATEGGSVLLCKRHTYPNL